MIRNFFIILILGFFQFSCTENTNSEEYQQQLDAQRREDAEERNQMIDNNDDYKVRRIPAEKDEPRPDDD